MEVRGGGEGKVERSRYTANMEKGACWKGEERKALMNGWGRGICTLIFLDLIQPTKNFMMYVVLASYAIYC